jgi:pilus assembly protein Flp/PilA
LVVRRRDDEPVPFLSIFDQGEVMLKNLKKLIKDEEGATAVEYGLIVAAIAGLIIVVVFLLGNKVNNAFSNVASHMP